MQRESRKKRIRSYQILRWQMNECDIVDMLMGIEPFQIEMKWDVIIFVLAYCCLENTAQYRCKCVCCNYSRICDLAIGLFDVVRIIFGRLEWQQPNKWKHSPIRNDTFCAVIQKYGRWET